MNSWLLQLAREDAAALAPLRLCPGVEVAEGPSALWLRGRGEEGWVQRALRGMPAVERYEWLPDDRLRRLESRIPADRLPVLSWQPLARWLQAELPVAALPGWEPRLVPLRLVRSGDETPADLLLADLGEWTRFALQCAEVRLRPLQFAVNAGGEVIVRGNPLPPLPGRRFVGQPPLSVAAGFAWQPAVSLAVVSRRLGLSPDAIALWHEDGTFTRLHSEQLIAATRSAVRATLRDLPTS